MLNGMDKEKEPPEGKGERYRTLSKGKAGKVCNVGETSSQIDEQLAQILALLAGQATGAQAQGKSAGPLPFRAGALQQQGSRVQRSSRKQRPQPYSARPQPRECRRTLQLPCKQEELRRRQTPLKTMHEGAGEQPRQGAVSPLKR